MTTKEKPMSETSISWFVDLVNPKFKNYNRPFVVALVIGGLTLGFTLIIFSIMVNDCFDYNAGSATYQRGAEELIKSPQVHCFYATQIMQWRTNDSGDAIGSMESDGCLWNYGGADKVCPDDGTNDWWLSLPNCEYKSFGEGWRSGITTVTFKSCPDPLSTLGAAFGYSALIELFFTGVVILPLLKLGLLKGEFLSVYCSPVRRGPSSNPYGVKQLPRFHNLLTSICSNPS